MTTRKATAADAADIITCYNETTKLAEFCIEGQPDRTMDEVDLMLQLGDVVIHTNQAGEVDAIFGYKWRNHTIPEGGVIAIHPQRVREQIPKIVGEMTTALFLDLKSHGFTEFRVRASAQARMAFPFSGAIGGTDEIFYDQETGRPSMINSIYNIDKALEELERLSSDGYEIEISL